MQTKPFILASASPRRRELLERIGLHFTIEAADTDETLVPGLSPAEQVMRLSRNKACAIAARHPEDPVILSADTVVVLEDTILGKPADADDARRMLHALSGRTHRVLTGVTVMQGSHCQTRCEVTEVHFAALSDAEIDAYVATGEPLDKAGAYGIQGYAAVFAAGISGDYYNVMGLPLHTAAKMLRQAGIPVLEAL